MMQKNKKIELLAPAGNFEKLETAIHYGADAVYLANKAFSLRNYSGNFTLDEMSEAVSYAHKNDVKVYTACNIFPRNFEVGAISDYLEKLGKIGPDAVIVADPGILAQARRIIPQIPIHLSTQANTTNFQAALFWESLGVERVNVARELSLEEIGEIAKRCSIEIEAFVHGAMCISYSGRCLMSTFMTKRDSNRGMCSHPCRWKYFAVEELRPGEYLPIFEDDRGSYIFNSKDLCMIEHIPELMESGIASFKIEGRMKGINYLASTVKVYREAIDAYYDDPSKYHTKKEWIEELASINNRDYCSGFYFGDPDQVAPNYVNHKPLIGHLFVGKVIKRSGKMRMDIEVRNKIFKGDLVEVVGQKGPPCCLGKQAHQG
jgi:putative protease